MLMYVDSEDEVCPLLRTVMEKGNITTYEWRTGTKPTSVVDTAFHQQNTQDEEETTNNENEEVRFSNNVPLVRHTYEKLTQIIHVYG